ncbi:uncharacterized protein LOC120432347 [Culex pipiens pallens]|uniref:uncharacterized protein LOC120432347 n=1 Tax=Culex pipiens pallens TaxID=42434 RepID=UPI0022AA0C5A|nr:uncharacterized protein LOC120432347 [Culex pipiens pallens]
MGPRLVPFQTSSARLKKKPAAAGGTSSLPESRKKRTRCLSWQADAANYWASITPSESTNFYRGFGPSAKMSRQGRTGFSVRIAFLLNLSMFPLQIPSGGPRHLLTCPPSSEQQKAGWPPD